MRDIFKCCTIKIELLGIWVARQLGKEPFLVLEQSCWPSVFVVMTGTPKVGSSPPHPIPLTCLYARGGGGGGGGGGGAMLLHPQMLSHMHVFGYFGFIWQNDCSTHLYKWVGPHGNPRGQQTAKLDIVCWVREILLSIPVCCFYYCISETTVKYNIAWSLYSIVSLHLTYVVKLVYVYS